MIERRKYQHDHTAGGVIEGLLGALLFAVALFLARPAAADEFRPESQIQAPTAYVSGAPLPLAEIDEFRLYCDGVQQAAITPTGPVTSWQAAPRQFPAGNHSCHATAVDLTGAESGPSNTVVFTVSADRPAAPALSIVAGGGAG